MGISSQLLGQYESGKRIPKTQFFLKWKSVFGDDLLKEIEANASAVGKTLQGPVLEPDQPKTATLDDLTESTKKLSESNLINAKNIDRLITMLEKKNAPVSSGLNEDILSTFFERNAAIQEVLLEHLAKSEGTTIEELDANVNRKMIERQKAGVQRGNR
jgi:transcriptional regulator with XRE-family HTH domain